MAEKTIPSSCAQGKKNSPQSLISLEFLSDGATPVVSSLHLAEHFEIRHRDVLRDIRAVLHKVPQDFYERNFAPIEIDVLLPHSGGIRKDPAYLLTRDAFTLLAMGYNSARAIAWKLRYIEAFNALEAAALHNARVAALADGAQLAYSLHPKEKRRLREVVRYRRMGLGICGIAKLMDVHSREVSYLLKVAVALGRLPENHRAAPFKAVTA